MHAQAPAAISNMAFNYFDIVVVVWLIIGVLRGRKLGMSQELLPMLKWITIVIVAGLFYRPFSLIIRQNTSTGFDPLWANVTAYVIIMLGILLVFTWIKKAIGDKLVGSDIFGSAEYYLGMLGGMIRFACMLLVLLALMHSRLYTTEELVATAKMQKQAFEDISFPTYGSIQHAVLSQSFTGRLVSENLPMILIASVTPDQRPKRETPAHKEQDVLDSVIGAPKK